MSSPSKLPKLRRKKSSLPTRYRKSASRRPSERKRIEQEDMERKRGYTQSQKLVSRAMNRYKSYLPDVNIPKEIDKFQTCIRHEGFSSYRMLRGARCPYEMYDIFMDFVTGRCTYMVFTDTKVKVYKKLWGSPPIRLFFLQPNLPKGYFVVDLDYSGGSWTYMNSEDKHYRSIPVEPLQIKQMISSCSQISINPAVWKRREVPRRSRGLPHGLNPNEYGNCAIFMPRNRMMYGEYSFWEDEDAEYDGDDPSRDPRRPGIGGDDMIYVHIHIRANNYRGRLMKDSYSKREVNTTAIQAIEGGILDSDLYDPNLVREIFKYKGNR